jgi:hypothetical protein
VAADVAAMSETDVRIVDVRVTENAGEVAK